MANQVYSITQNSWNGGISYDKISGAPNTVQWAEAVDLRSNSNMLTPAKLVAKTSGSIVVDAINCFVTVGKYVIAFGNAGNVYKRESPGADSNSYVKVLTLGSGDSIRGACVWNGYLYYCTDAELYRLDVATVKSSDSWSAPTDLLNTGSYPAAFKSVAASTGTPNFRPMIEAFNKLYIGDGCWVMELEDIAGTITGENNRLEIHHSHDIFGITFNGSVLKFYGHETTTASNVAASGDSYTYLWDGVEDSYNSLLKWSNIWLGAVCSLNGIDYAVGADKGLSPYLYYPALYVTNGAEYQVAYPVLPTTSLYPFTMCQFGLNTIAIAGSRGVMTYGSRYAGEPMSLCYEYPSALADDSNMRVTAIHAVDSVLLFAYTDHVPNPDTYGIDRVSSFANTTTGFIITKLFGDRDFARAKRLMAIDLAFSTLVTLADINIYLRKDWGGLVENTAELIRYRFAEGNEGTDFNFGSAIASAKTDGRTNMLRIDDPDTLAAFCEFYTLEMKIELDGTGATTAPVLFQTKVYYEYIND